MAVTLTIPRDKVATQASEFATNVSGASFACYSFGAQDLANNTTNSVSISNSPTSFDQFTLSDADNQPTIVAALTAGEYAVLAEQSALFLWAYTNTTSIAEGITISSTPLSRDILLARSASNEKLFDGASDWQNGEQIQSLGAGRSFTNYDLIVVFYQTQNVATTNKRDWTILRTETAPLIAGGFDNSIFETVSDNQFRLNNNTLMSGLNASPQTAGLEIWGI